MYNAVFIFWITRSIAHLCSHCLVSSELLSPLPCLLFDVLFVSIRVAEMRFHSSCQIPFVVAVKAWCGCRSYCIWSTTCRTILFVSFAFRSFSTYVITSGVRDKSAFQLVTIDILFYNNSSTYCMTIEETRPATY
jgi:hypothetical protein